MEHPKAVGDRTTVAVMAALQANGYAILVPFGENTRYDLAIDDGTGLRRVQCKTGRLREGGIHFAACSSYGHHLRPKDAVATIAERSISSASTVRRRQGSTWNRSTTSTCA